MKPSCTLFIHVFLNILLSDFRAVNVTSRVDGVAFRGACAGGLFSRIGNESDNFSILQAAPANAALPAIVIARDRFRFRIGDIEHMVLIEPDSAGPAKLAEFLQVVAVQIEYLD